MMMKSLHFYLLGALLVVQAVSAQPATGVTTSGYLRRKFPCTQPDPPKATFAWAQVSASLFQNSAATPSCKVACNNFRLGPVSNLPSNTSFPTNNLCRFSYTSAAGASSTVYGTTQLTNGDYLCFAKTVDGDKFTASFDCGCCGTINQEGKRYSTGCNLVTAFVASNLPCPANTTWTAPAGQQICRAPSPTAGAALVFGLITPQNATGQCFVPQVGTTGPVATFERLCYQINPYTGPPAPDCKKKNNSGK